jgi:hypothetical protein
MSNMSLNQRRDVDYEQHADCYRCCLRMRDGALTLFFCANMRAGAAAWSGDAGRRAFTTHAARDIRRFAENEGLFDATYYIRQNMMEDYAGGAVKKSPSRHSSRGRVQNSHR